MLPMILIVQELVLVLQQLSQVTAVETEDFSYAPDWMSHGLGISAVWSVCARTCHACFGVVCWASCHVMR